MFLGNIVVSLLDFWFFFQPSSKEIIISKSLKEEEMLLKLGDSKLLKLVIWKNYSIF